jgi:ABC-type nitrate/sulfonate/bicarbonate transport system permease component
MSEQAAGTVTSFVPSPRRNVARYSNAALGTLGALLVLVAWELCARFVWKDAQVLPAPSQAIADAYRHLTLGELAQDVGWSLWRIIAGFAIGAAAGVALGVACGWYRGLARIARPIIELLRPIPPLAWIPIAIVWFGLGETSKVFVIFLGAFFPIFTNAWRGMASVPPVLLAAARTMDVEGPALLFKVALPAALPDIATGLRVGFGLSFGILVAAELIAADRGMGFLVMQSRQVGQLGVAIFAILLIGVVTLLADGALAAALRRLLRHRVQAR